VIEELRQLVRRQDIYVVGGAVRDLCLGRAQISPDIDLLLPAHDFQGLLAEVAEVFGCSPFPLSGERGFFRFVVGEETCDLSPLTGELTANLAQRDFTVNSMALSLDDYLERRLNKIHDPHGGRAHLKQKLLCTTHPLALQNDAVRILRAARLMAEYDFSPGPKLTPAVQAELSKLDLHQQAVCKLGALLHDMGKPSTRAVREDGRVTFYRHEQVGQEMVSAVSRRLKLSQAEHKALSRFVRWHMYLGQLARLPRLHNGHIYRIARRYGEQSVPLALFALADFRGKGGEAQTEEDYSQIVRTTEAFLEAWLFKKAEIISPPLPITAPELMQELKLPPGKWLGETLDHLSEQAAMGKLVSREQAVSLAREFCKQR